MYELYANIREFRQELNLSQSELAAKTGYGDRSSIAKIEQGKIDLPISKIPVFAKALQVTITQLMGNTWDNYTQSDAKKSFKEEMLLTDFRQLNDDGQDRVCEYTSDLVASGRYNIRAGDGSGSGSSQEETA